MGMLAYGAMAGVGGEYLKQSDETRKNDFTLLRDRRLSELKKGEATHASGLVGGREEVARKHGDENFTAALTSNVYRDGEMVQKGTHRPTAGSYVDPDDRPLLTKSGDTTSWGSLRSDYEAEWTSIDEWGTKVTKEGAPTLTEYRNKILDERHALAVEKAEAAVPDDLPEEEKPGWIARAYDYFLKPDEKPEEGRGGMLTESGTETEKKEKPKGLGLKMPLSRASKTDPTQMYIELHAQGFDDQSIEDTIRGFFKDPTWTIPPPSALK